MRGYIRFNKSTIGGAVVTIIATAVFMITPTVVSFDVFQEHLYAVTGHWMRDDPRAPLRYLGGFIGGFIAGYLTPNTVYDSITNSIHAALLGVGGLYILNVSYNLFQVSRVGPVEPSLVPLIAIQLLFFLLVPFSILYILESMIGGIIGYWIRGVDIAKHDEDVVDGPSRSTSLPVVRLAETGLAVLVLLTLFAVGWYVAFYFMLT